MFVFLSFGALPQDTPPAEALSSDFITPSPTTLADNRMPSAPAKKVCVCFLPCNAVAGGHGPPLCSANNILCAGYVP